MADDTPSIRLLFSQLSPHHRLFILIPAILSSILSGGIAPFMTLVVGQAFNAFSQFPLTQNPPQSAKAALLHKVGNAALQLMALAVGSFVLGSVTSSLWIWTGERNVMALRKRVYKAVTQKDMVWFDTKMGAESTVQSADGEQGPLGAGGLMSKFTRFVVQMSHVLCCFEKHLFFSQRNRRRTHRIITSIRDAPPIPHNLHNMSHPRLYPFLVPNAHHPLRRPPPHFRSSPLPIPRLTPPRSRAHRISNSSNPRRPRTSLHRHRQSIQRCTVRATLPRRRP